MLCFFVPVATISVILKIQKKQVKREVKWKIIAGIDREELVLLKFTQKEKQTQLNWKHSKEFEHKGEMYDVVETETIGDTTYYWLWWDYEETKLSRQLSELISVALANNPKNQENQKRLHNFFKSLYFSEDIKKETLVFLDESKKCPFLDKFYRLVSPSPPEPPPKKS